MAMTSRSEKKQGITLKQLKSQKVLILLSIPFIIYVIIFCYVPLGGWLMAFQNYKPKNGLLHSEFVGLAKFEFLFSNDQFLKVIRNTLAMGVINLVLGTVTAILFAILLSEFRFNRGKKLVQTISYLPHFLSWVIVTGIVFDVLSTENGIVNEILVNLHIIDKPFNFLADPKWFWWIVGFANILEQVKDDKPKPVRIQPKKRPLMKVIWTAAIAVAASVAVLLVLNIDFSASSSQPSQVNNGIQEVDKAFAQLSSADQAYLLSVYQEDVFLNN